MANAKVILARHGVNGGHVDGGYCTARSSSAPYGPRSRVRVSAREERSSLAVRVESIRPNYSTQPIWIDSEIRTWITSTTVGFLFRRAFWTATIAAVAESRSNCRWDWH